MSRFRLFFCVITFCIYLPVYASERTIFYPSGKLKISALIITPEKAQHYLSSDRYAHNDNGVAEKRPALELNPGRELNPVILFNHGGISGLNENSKRRCRELSAQGYVVFASSFRGEDRSEGKVEVALGEVDDVLAGLRWLEQNANFERADLDRVGLLGFSHGALISLQAAKRAHRFKALVFSYGVSDIYTWVQYLRDTKQMGQDALSMKIYGTGPQSRPNEYAARYGLANLDKLDPNLEVLIMQGKLDEIVPPAQAEALANALKANAIKTTVRYFSDATHGFLIRREALIGLEKQQSDQAWREINAFLLRVLKPTKLSMRPNSRNRGVVN